MKALKYDHATQQVTLKTAYPRPVPADGEALIKVLRAGVCSTDIEITRGYVPGYCAVLGHEFVGRVEQCDSRCDLVGKRVVGEININCGNFTCADAIFQRNHAPGRTVLGIINKDGCLAEYVTLPADNLHAVPDGVSDEAAAFTEPLAAACRILEQGLVGAGASGARQRIAVIGDGKLGLLCAQVLAVAAPGQVTLLGRHADKMALVQGLASHEAAEGAVSRHAAAFDLVVEATGASAGVRTALALVRPLGTLLLKSTVAPGSADAPSWAELANDIVVNEKVLVGSRCGPFDIALRMMVEHESIRQLLAAMLHKSFSIDDGVAAVTHAQSRGVLKVQVVF